MNKCFPSKVFLGHMFSRGERIFAMYVANFMEQFVMCYYRLWIKKKVVWTLQGGQHVEISASRNDLELLEDIAHGNNYTDLTPKSPVGPISLLSIIFHTFACSLAIGNISFCAFSNLNRQLSKLAYRCRLNLKNSDNNNLRRLCFLNPLWQGYKLQSNIPYGGRDTKLRLALKKKKKTVHASPLILQA